MNVAQKIVLALLAVLMLGGRTAYLSQAHESHYFFLLNDGVITTSEAFTPCAAATGQTETLGKAWCIIPNGRMETLRSFTVAVTAAIDGGAVDDCTLTLETSTDLSTWTAVSSSVIHTGPGLTNLAGACAAGTLVLDAVGEHCTRVIADGVTVPAGGAWRVAISSTGTCTDLTAVGAHVSSIYQ